jgi:hypothetical protein
MSERTAALLDHAFALIVPPASPSVTDLRRALSAAYYAGFHYCCFQVATLFIGRHGPDHPAWELVYRSLDHGPITNACRALAGQGSTHGPTVKRFAQVMIELRAVREDGDYHPADDGVPNFFSALTTLASAKAAFMLMDRITDSERRDVFARMAFKPLKQRG